MCSQVLGDIRSDPSEDVFAGPGALLADDAGDPELGGFEDVLLLEELLRLRIECSGLFEVPGLLEDEFLQSRRLGIAEVVQPEIAGDGLLVLGDGLLAFAVELDQARINSQLGRAEPHQLVDDFEWLLFREAIEQTDEGNLVGEAEPIVGASALADLCPGLLSVSARGAFELLARENICSS